MVFARYIGILFCLGAVFWDFSVSAQSLSQLRFRARQIEEQISQIRELTFKRSVEVDLQSASDFQVYAERQIDQQYSAMDWKYYDRVVRKLGLYRGEIILDRSLVLEFLQASAVAYYDPEKDRFFILKQNLPEAVLDGVLAHELCHGLQDQHFDLDQFLRAQINTLNSDEILARRAVGEGEATYIQTIWTLKNLIGQMPEQELLQRVIDTQMQLDIQTLREEMKKVALLQDDSQAVIETIDTLPGFMILQQAAAYVFGLNFVHHIQKQGWEKVDRLYANPPVSTEQILHPSKWLSGETPDRLTWPPFQGEAIFDNWDLLDEDTLGELTWRIIFSEFDMKVRGESAADGWNGGRYAVFRSQDGQALLFLLYTSWDTEDDADEFAETYRELLTVKYPSGDTPNAISRHGRDVLILESDLNVDTDAILTFMGTMRTWEQEVISRADFNGSGQIDFDDFLLFAQNFGKHEGTVDFDPIYDLNQDGQVNFPDFLTFAKHFGKSIS